MIGLSVPEIQHQPSIHIQILVKHYGIITKHLEHFFRLDFKLFRSAFAETEANFCGTIMLVQAVAGKMDFR